MTSTVAIGLYFFRHIIAHLNCLKKIKTNMNLCLWFQADKIRNTGICRHLVLIGAIWAFIFGHFPVGSSTFPGFCVGDFFRLWSAMTTMFLARFFCPSFFAYLYFRILCTAHLITWWITVLSGGWWPFLCPLFPGRLLPLGLLSLFLRFIWAFTWRLCTFHLLFLFFLQFFVWTLLLLFLVTLLWTFTFARFLFFLFFVPWFLLSIRFPFTSFFPSIAERGIVNNKCQDTSQWGLEVKFIKLIEIMINYSLYIRVYTYG